MMMTMMIRFLQRNLTTLQSLLSALVNYNFLAWSDCWLAFLYLYRRSARPVEFRTHTHTRTHAHTHTRIIPRTPRACYASYDLISPPSVRTCVALACSTRYAYVSTGAAASPPTGPSTLPLSPHRADQISASEFTSRNLPQYR